MVVKEIIDDLPVQPWLCLPVQPWLCSYTHKLKLYNTNNLVYKIYSNSVCTTLPVLCDNQNSISHTDSLAIHLPWTQRALEHAWVDYTLFNLVLMLHISFIKLFDQQNKAKHAIASWLLNNTKHATAYYFRTSRSPVLEIPPRLSLCCWKPSKLFFMHSHNWIQCLMML